MGLIALKSKCKPLKVTSVGVAQKENRREINQRDRIWRSMLGGFQRIYESYELNVNLFVYLFCLFVDLAFLSNYSSFSSIFSINQVLCFSCNSPQLSYLLTFKRIFVSCNEKNVNKWLTKRNLCKFFPTSEPAEKENTTSGKKNFQEKI